VLKFSEIYPPEIGEIVRYLPDKKTKFRLPRKLSPCRYCADRARNLPGPDWTAPNNVLTVLQIDTALPLKKFNVCTLAQKSDD